MADGIPQWIEETRVAVDRAGQADRAQMDFEALITASEEIGHVLPSLAELRNAAELGRGVWWTGLDVDPGLLADLDEAQRALDTWQQALERRKLTNVARRLTRLEPRLREAVMAAWKEYVASQAGDAAELRDLMQVLSGAEGIADVARQLNEALGRLARLERRLPDARSLEVLDEVSALFGHLEGRLPVAVKTFVSAAARGGASLELFDAEVREWLIDNGALENFRAVPGRPQEVRHG
ncbi:hypothetical protein [Actinomadura luteofluorescens]